MGKPAVAPLLPGDAGLFAAVGVHAPDLHQAAAHGVEPDLLSVRRVFGAVAEAGREGEAGLLAALHGNGVCLLYTSRCV